MPARATSPLEQAIERVRPMIARRNTTISDLGEKASMRKIVFVSAMHMAGLEPLTWAGT